MNKIFFGLLAMTLLFVSCKKEDSKPEVKPIKKIKLGEATTTKNEKMILWSDAALTTGFHKIYLSVTDIANKILSNAIVNFQPFNGHGDHETQQPGRAACLQSYFRYV